ncbi:cation:proton antiporter [Rubrivirga litoralis]|uniref:Cation:proton antiporter n=1 Tax=Rubrivirga litoralis TaxID=3075598 RepID=A0ABU3BQJ6_9BACT|nr:cation:proton antiporter [Rubrivirga sp. F394]MDT0631461.1 cation:proton antiporter [Rubrivirga sp. F394]
MDPRILLFVLAGLGLIGAVALEPVLRRLPVSLPMVYVGIGWLVFSLPLGLPTLDPVGNEVHAVAAEYLTEFIVIASLMAVGIAIDRPFSWSGWGQVWPLLGVTMVLSVAAVALLGWAWLGLTPAAAILLGAALSPTDPVLAGSVQVGPPGESERDDVRFDLTVEAGLNDGLAFPFTHLAIAAVGVSSLGAWTAEWVALDVVWRIAAGVAVGYAVGRAGAWYVFERSEETDSDGDAEADGDAEEADDDKGRTNEGLIVMGTLLAAYGLAELAHGYGFLAVFVGAVTARQRRSESGYHAIAHHFIDQLESVVLVVMLLGFGGLLASGILSALTVEAALFGLAAIFVVRPLAGIVGLLRCPLPWPGRWAVAFLGIRGMGTLYYLAYGQTHADFADLDVLWATASFTILASILVHGMTAGAVMERLERRGENVIAGAESDVAVTRG